MARKLDQALVEILQKYHPSPRDAVWDCHGTWVILHKAVELIAAKAGVQFDAPYIIHADPDKKNVAICVTGSLGEHSEWSIGEAAPYNNKNVYPFAMAEKRAKDRVVLKLVGLHGHLYSEDEADDFQRGKPVNDQPSIPEPEPTNEPTYSELDSDALREALIAEIGEIKIPKELMIWGETHAAEISEMQPEHRQEIRQAFSIRKTALQDVA